jgi:hypothetical protein
MGRLQVTFIGKSGFFRALFTGLIVATAYAASAPFAHAQGRAADCGEYAREASEQAVQADRNRCDFRGPRWNADRGAHFAWCMLVGPRQAEDENRARQDDLRRCTADRGGGRDRDRDGDRGGGRGNREGKRASCDTYSSIAAIQADANDKYRCGNRGGEWSNDKRGHFDWCMRNKREFTLDEMRYRAQELQKCFNNLGDYDDDNWDRNYRRRF